VWLRREIMREKLIKFSDVKKSAVNPFPAVGNFTKAFALLLAERIEISGEVTKEEYPGLGGTSRRGPCC
jgi:hypothetical protein